MIETPSASLIADRLARECDFFSIGTRDLIGYTMCMTAAADRVAYLYEVYQPSVLRSLKFLIGTRSSRKIMVVCAASSYRATAFIPVLLSLLVWTSSPFLPSVLRTRKTIAAGPKG